MDLGDNMSDTQTIESTSSAPAPVETGEMSAAEKAYFSSRGEDASGLFSDKAPNGHNQPAEPDGHIAENIDGEDIDGEINLDGNGPARDLKTGKFVPKSAFLRVKGESKELKAANQAYRDNLIAARERLAILTEAASPQTQAARSAEPEREIDPEEDIFGAFKQAMNKVKALEGRLTEVTTKSDAERQTAAMQNSFKSDMTAFEARTPDFKDAFAHVVSSRHAQLEAMGLTDKSARDKQIATEARDLIEEDLQAKRSPSERLYRLAKAYGYQAKAQQNSLEKASQEIARLEKNQAASMTLRGAGSAGVGETLTLDRYASMSDDAASSARANYIAKHGEGSWRKFLGG